MLYSSFPPAIYFAHGNVYISTLLSQSIPPPSPSVSTSPFSTSASLFLKQVKLLPLDFHPHYSLYIKCPSPALPMTSSFPIVRSQLSSDSKESAFNAEDLSAILGLGRSPAEGNGNPLQYSCLENPMDRGVWQATVHGVVKSQTRLSD